MSAITAESGLHAFAYGEHRDGNRSLGFRLLTPTGESWAAEVEALARRLQAAPYPDQWPSTELFCSVLLDDGRRLVALARYGLTDSTPGQRTGGLELIGIVGPAGLSVTAALAVYQWLRLKRAADESPLLTGTLDLIEVLAEAPAPPPVGEAVPVLPIQLWREGALLFAASSPADPDLRLGMLEHCGSDKWQWLPLVGPDFPLAAYARRGPLVAWTPHLASVALRLDQPQPPPSPSRRRRSVWGPILLGAITALLAANLWAVLDLRYRLDRITAVPASLPADSFAPGSPHGDDPRERFGRSLYKVLSQQGVLRDHDAKRLLEQYDRLTVQEPGLRLASPEGQQAIGALAILSRRSPARVEEIIREVGSRGYDRELIDLLAQKVSRRLVEN